ncbi:MAG: thiolase family protein [Sporichthyaceae bacterium]
MSAVYVAGAAMTPFGKSTGTISDLAGAAVRDALADAGIEPREVQQVFFGNSGAGLLQGQEMIRGQVYLHDTGLLGSAIFNIENACAASSSAFALACAAVLSGQADIALAVGAERLIVADKTRAFAALASATDTERRPEMRSMVWDLALGGSADPQFPASSPLMENYAAKGAAYLEKTGGTARDLAALVVKSRLYGSRNPRAHFRKTTTVEEVLAGRLISHPLHMAMCSPLSDGAAALVVMSERAARARGKAAVRVLATSIVSNDPAQAPPTVRAAAQAYERAGIGPGDVDVVEVHDAAAPAELIAIEELGLTPPGTAIKLLRDGATGPGGSLPVNPDGGLLSRGHPIGATGAAQLVELVDHLLRRAGTRQVSDARIGLAQNAGGVFHGDEATVSVTILQATGSAGA